MLRFRTPRLRLARWWFSGIIAVLSALATAQAPAQAQAPDTSPGASRLPSPLASQIFHDQFGRATSLAGERGAPLIVVVVSVRRLAMIEPWERDLHERAPDIRFLNVADLPDDAPVDLERTAATLRKRVPPGVAVLMDPARQWATTFALDTAVPNLLIFDAGGQLTARFRGRWTAELAGQVADAVAQKAPNP